METETPFLLKSAIGRKINFRFKPDEQTSPIWISGIFIGSDKNLYFIIDSKTGKPKGYQIKYVSQLEVM